MLHTQLACAFKDRRQAGAVPGVTSQPQANTPAMCICMCVCLHERSMCLDPCCFLCITGENTIAMSNLCRDESCYILEDKIEVRPAPPFFLCAHVVAGASSVAAWCTSALPWLLVLGVWLLLWGLTSLRAQTQSRSFKQHEPLKEKEQRTLRKTTPTGKPLFATHSCGLACSHNAALPFDHVAFSPGRV